MCMYGVQLGSPNSSLGRSRTHARQFHWANGGRPRACSCIVDRCSTSGPRQAPSQIPRRPIAQSRAPSSVSLCRSISASLLLRDHVYSTLQTPSRAPSSQPSTADSQPDPFPSTDAVPTLSIAQLFCSNRTIPTASSPQRHVRPATPTPLPIVATSSAAWRCSRSAPRPPPPTDREGSPIPALPRRGHAVLNMRKRETHPYVSQHNER